MDSKMTGEPNQQNPTSVFGFETYPPSFMVNWNQTNPFSNVPQYNTVMNEGQPIFRQDTGLPFSTPVNMPSHLTVGPSNPTSISSPVNYALDQQAADFSFGSPKPQPEVVHFPFETYTTSFGTRELRCKRKTDSPPLQPAKQHITEEKMAEHMSKLHISSETVIAKESDSRRMQRLYMCEEMRKLQTDCILPQTLLSRIQRPCTALVLWKPPSRIVPILGSTNERYESETKTNKSDDATNETEMNDIPLNDMDLDGC